MVHDAVVEVARRVGLDCNTLKGVFVGSVIMTQDQQSFRCTETFGAILHFWFRVAVAIASRDVACYKPFARLATVHPEAIHCHRHLVKVHC